MWFKSVRTQPFFPPKMKPKHPEVSPNSLKANRRVIASVALCILAASFAWFSPSQHVQTTTISRSRFDDGLAKCAKISSWAVKETPEARSNPRFGLGNDEAAPDLWIRNATLWDGDGSITYGVDILVQNGLVSSVGDPLDLQSFDGVEINARGRFVTPGLVDMHSPWDSAIDIINSGGVTTSLVLPGSGNMMGGEAFAFKHRRTSSNRASDMLLNAGMGTEDGARWRWMKMACGENPIRSYGESKGVMPESRMGEGYLFRKRMDEALQAKTSQDDWCEIADHHSKSFGAKAFSKMTTPFPDPIEQESLIALLRGEVLLNVHCYETYDLEMMVRLSDEYNFKIRAFHHALEAWRVPELLKSNDISADHWGYKKEAYDTSVKAAQALSKAGVKVAFKSDHPVINSQHLIYEAAKAHHYGYDAKLAIQAVTSVPAERLGQDWRIGYLKEGYDADLVLWDKNPLEIGAHPLKVFVDGFSTFQHDDYEKTMKLDFKPRVSSVPQKLDIDVPADLGLMETVTYSNAAGIVHSPDATWERGSKIVVKDGLVSCIGATCESSGKVVDLKGGWVIPGLIASGVHLGLEEMESEDATSAGGVVSDELVRTSDSIHVGRKHSRILDAAFKAAGSLASTISGQISMIKKHLVSDSGPNVIRVDGASYIASILRDRTVNMTIMGGAEAHVVADLLGPDVSVILSPGRCTPNSWFKQECKLASSTPSSLELLLQKGVNVGISIDQDNFLRGLMWEAGWHVADLGAYDKMTDFEKAKNAAALVTWNVAKAFGIEDVAGIIAVGRKPNFVVYGGVPGTLDAKVSLVVDGELIESDTEQY